MDYERVEQSVGRSDAAVVAAAERCFVPELVAAEAAGRCSEPEPVAAEAVERYFALEPVAAAVGTAQKLVEPPVVASVGVWEGTIVSLELAVGMAPSRVDQPAEAPAPAGHVPGSR